MLELNTMKKQISIFLLTLFALLQSPALAQTVAPNIYVDNLGVHVVSNAAQSIYPTVPLINQLRIYATSGSPFSNTAYTTASVPTPISAFYIGGRTDGNQCTFNQGSNYQILNVPETLFTVSGLTASTRYDLYMKNINGLITISTVAWTGTATPPTRGTDGYNRATKSGDTTSLLIGTFLANTSTTASLFTSISDNAFYAGTPAGTYMPWWQPSSSTPIPTGFALCNGASAVWQTGDLAGTTFTLPNFIGRMVLGSDVLSGTSTASSGGYGTTTPQTTYGLTATTISVTVYPNYSVGATAQAGAGIYPSATGSGSGSNLNACISSPYIMKL